MEACHLGRETACHASVRRGQEERHTRGAISALVAAAQAIADREQDRCLQRRANGERRFGIGLRTGGPDDEGIGRREQEDRPEVGEQFPDPDPGTEDRADR